MTDLMETRIMAKMRYFPSSGTTSDVGGMISTTSKKNTYKLVRIEMDSVTWWTKNKTNERFFFFFSKPRS